MKDMSKLDLVSVHMAAKLLEQEGVGGYDRASVIVGANSALCMLVMQLRNTSGSTKTFPSGKGEEKVNKILYDNGIVRLKHKKQLTS